MAILTLNLRLFFLSFSSNILFLTGGGDIILLVMLPDRYTAKTERFWALRMGVFWRCGLVSYRSGCTERKGSGAGSVRGLMSGEREGPPSLSHWDRDRGQRHTTSAHTCPDTCAHTCWQNTLRTHTWTNTDVTFLGNSSQMARFRFCALRCCKRIKHQIWDDLRDLTSFDLYSPSQKFIHLCVVIWSRTAYSELLSGIRLNKYTPANICQLQIVVTEEFSHTRKMCCVYVYDL